MDEDEEDFDDVIDEIVIPQGTLRMRWALPPDEARLDKKKTAKDDDLDDWSLEDGSEVETAVSTASLKQTIEVNLFKNHMQEISLKVKDNINIILGSGGDDVKACEYLVRSN